MHKNEIIDEKATGLEIAVIGMAVRIPGAGTIDEFWHNIINGVESIRFFSDLELEEAGVDPVLLKNPNYVKAMGVLEDAMYFDASFFGYSPSEALFMPPQVRIFHECVWSALENAGYNPGVYDGRIGIYAGASSSAHWETLALLEASIGVENDPFSNDILANKDNITTRIAYKLNLKGPALVVQTACSTSLTAIHLAIQGLLTGECEMALAGGTSVLKSGQSGYLYQEGMVLAKDGHVRAFDAAASGFVRGEGAAAVLLKSLAEAISDNDHIYAVVKGSAINNDGSRKVGYAAPSVEGQADTIKAAQYAAEVEPESIGYIEAHGSATRMGDIVEIEALKGAFKTNKKRFCAIGSVKTNVGHLDTAAGAAGFIKTALALYHQMIPPSLHFETPNPHIDFENSPFFVPTQARVWKANIPGYPLRAGVSSFGIGGTNVHVVLEEWKHNRDQETDEKAYRLILLSAGTGKALKQVTENLGNYFKKNSHLSLADAAYTLQVGRKYFPYRKVLVCQNLPGAAEELLTQDTDVFQSHFSEMENPPIIFIFPGLGAQYINMGRELYDTEPEFRKFMDNSFDILNSMPDYNYNLKEILYPNTLPGVMPGKDAVDIHDPEISQPLIFIFEYALAKLLMKWGIRPHIMIGYSFGEYAAACLSEVFHLKDALQLTVIRGKLLKKAPEGAMLSVPKSKEELLPILPEDLSFSIDNGTSCIVGGTPEAIATFEMKMKAQRCISMRLNASRAVHSHLMEPILEDFEKAVAALSLEKPRIPFISNVTARPITDKQAVDPRYWTGHLRQTVRFADGISELSREPGALFLEIGPGRDIAAMAARYIEKQRIINLVRPAEIDRPDIYYLLNRIGRLWMHGAAIEWKEFYSSEKRYRIPLPTYPFERQKYRFEGNLISRVLEFLKKDIRTTEGETPNVPKIKISKNLEEEANPGQQFSMPQGRPNVTAPYKAPQTSIEIAIAEILQKMLRYERVGIDDDFFELGLDSVKSIQIRSRMIKNGYNVELEDFFKYPTIQKLAPMVRNLEEKTGYADPETMKIPIETMERLYKKYPDQVCDVYPLTPMQEGMFFYSLYETNNIQAYFEQVSYHLHDRLDVSLVEKSINELIKRHDILRTAFFHEGLERPLQIVLKERKAEFDYIDMRHIAAGNRHEQEVFCREYLEKNKKRPFDLSKDVLIRVNVMQIKDEEFILVWSYHHILMDGWCLGILTSEYFEIYNSLREDRASRLHPVPPFRQYIQWLESRDKAEALNFWKTYLDGYEEIAAIPKKKKLVDKVQAMQEAYSAGGVGTTLEKEKNRCLQNISIRNHVTLNTIFQVVWAIVLGKYSGKQDVVFGSVVSGRPYTLEGVEAMVGCFINTIPVRIAFDRHTTFMQLIRDTQENALQSEPYHYLSLAEIQSLTPLKQNLLDHFLEFQNLPLVKQIEQLDDRFANENRSDKRNLSHVQIFEQGNYDFVFDIQPGDNLVLTFGYNANVYDGDLMKRLGSHTMRVLDQIIRNEEISIGALTLLSEEEKRQIITEFNKKAVLIPDETVYHQLEKHAQLTPDRTAAVFRENWVTYRQLNEQSNRLAGLLMFHGIREDNTVGILLERSPLMMACILGVWKAGGAYLPIDPGYPEERINFMLADSNAKILIGSEESQKKRIANCQMLIVKDESLMTTPHTPFHHSSSIIHHANYLAYIIYTSGSTGKPRGAMIEHAGMMNHIQAKIHELQLNPGSIIAQNASQTFDISVWQFFTGLVLGSRTVIYPDTVILELQTFVSHIVKDGITILEIVPSYLTLILDMLDNQPDNQEKTVNLLLEYLLVTGEEIKPKLVKRWFEHFPAIKMVNAYGPTEASDDITHYIMEHLPPEVERIPIGHPLQNLNIYIVDKFMHLCPIGVIGEIWVSGIGVGRGYVGDFDETKQVFISDPFDEEKKSRLYKTGDLGRWLPNGIIEFFGRKDYQVKIRGFRIELGEIEKQLINYPNTKSAVVIDREDESGNKYLCSYIVFNNEETGVIDLKEYLSSQLPAYMIPSHFIPVQEIPLTPNGKIDRKSLPEPLPGKQEEFVPPGNEMQKMLVNIWAEVLNIDKRTISIHSNFFDLGGHSLKAVSVVSMLARDFDISIEQFFKNPTIAGLEKCIFLNKDRIKNQLKEIIKFFEDFPAPSTTGPRPRPAYGAQLEDEYEQYKRKVQEEQNIDLSGVRDYKHIMLTGGTGYLGAYLLYELLKNKGTYIYLPVRGSQKPDIEKRLEGVLSFYFGGDFYPAHKDRLVIFPGDMAKNKLGMEPGIYNELTSKIDVIIHSAGNVSHIGLYQDFFANNFKATENLLEFALETKRKDFNYISTMGVCSGKIEGKEFQLFSEYQQDWGQQVIGYYVKSKFEAEKCVAAYRQKGLQTSIYRPGNIVFHSETGKFQANISSNGFYNGVNAVIKFGIAPNNINMLYDFSFVDYVARSIVLLYDRKALTNELFHIYNNHYLSLLEMVTYFNRVGEKIQQVPLKEFIRYLHDNLNNIEIREQMDRFLIHYGFLLNITRESDSNELREEAEMARRSATMPRLVCDRTKMFLSKIGFEWPQVHEEHFRKMIHYCREVGFLK